MGLNWRRWNNVLHRDLGYLAVGLTILYAVSGLALNHMADWNPTYRRVEERHEIGPIPTRDQPEEALVTEALARLKVTDKAKKSYQPDEDTLHIFVEGATYTVDLPTGKVVAEANRPRPVLAAWNRLHLNAPKRTWTWVADIYAVTLLVLACTGLFVLKGPKGLTGRGAWLTLLGCLPPVAYWVWWVTF